jgi:hypothetical protein
MDFGESVSGEIDTVLLRLPGDAGETHEKFRSLGICFPAKMHIDILPKCLVLSVLEVVVVTLVMCLCQGLNLLLFHLTSDYHDKYSSSC